jgi:hypothetical protein
MRRQQNYERVRAEYQRQMADLKIARHRQRGSPLEGKSLRDEAVKQTACELKTTESQVLQIIKSSRHRGARAKR